MGRRTSDFGKNSEEYRQLEDQPCPLNVARKLDIPNQCSESTSQRKALLNLMENKKISTEYWKGNGQLILRTRVLEV